MEDSHNCSVTNCFFDQVGSNGVMVNGRNSNHRVEKCRFIAAGASAVAFVGDRHKSHGTYAAFPTDCSVKNCFMAELGYYDKQVAGVFISNSQRINASHNMIRNVPRAGILMNDGLVGGHDIAYNFIWNSVRDTSGTLRFAVPFCSEFADLELMYLVCQITGHLTYVVVQNKSRVSM